MARLPPIYERRARRDDIVFKAEDVRSLCNADVLERATEIKEEVEHIQNVLLEKLKELKGLNTPATREQDEGASKLLPFLWLFITLRFWQSEIEAEFSNYRPCKYDHKTDEMVLYTSRTSMTCLCANLGNFVRSRKQTLPKAYADLLDSRWENHVGPLVHSFGRAKAHVLMLCEASTLEADDLAFLEECGWTYIRNAAASFEAPNKNLYVSSRVHHFTANPVHLLKLYKNILGQPYSQVSKNISWDSLPGLDCMVGMFECGHSYPDSI